MAAFPKRGERQRRVKIRRSGMRDDPICDRSVSNLAGKDIAARRDRSFKDYASATRKD